MVKKSNIIITPEQLIQTYMLGIFPMSDSRNSEKTYFVNPEKRGVIPIKGFHVSKSLLRLIRKRPFKITLNNAFPEVIRSCATINRTDTWINTEIETLFVQLNKQHYAIVTLPIFFMVMTKKKRNHFVNGINDLSPLLRLFSSILLRMNVSNTMHF